MFNTGIAWLRQEINRLRQDRLHRQTQLKSVEEVVEIADPIIRLAHRYRKALLPSVETSIQYCKYLVNSVPGPVRLQRSSYHDNPLVKALFRSIEEMESLLQHAGKTAAPGGGRELFALLTMSKTETVFYGHKQQGEMILADVPMKAVTFVDHRIVAPAPDLHTTATQLEHENAEKIRELKELLSVTEKEIEQARKELETPDDTLGHLQRIMASPADTLALREFSLRLNWMNVIVEEKEETAFHDINLAELSLNEELRRLAILVSFDREAMG